MKTSVISIGILLVFSLCCYGVGPGIGLRSMAMGGTGIALANDASAAYFNPAGLMYGPENFSFDLFAGGAITNVQEVADALGSGSNFITDNFDKDLSANASVTTGLCFTARKIGFSLLADGFLLFDKPANSLNIDFSGTVNGYAPITVGSTFSTPLLPEVALGVNLKPTAHQSVVTSIKSSGVTGTGDQTMTSGSGFGFDVGMQTKILPILTIGAVVRNMSSSINAEVTKTSLTVDATGNVTESGETKSTKILSLPSEVGVGVAGIVPFTGTILTGDIENYYYNDEAFTDVHFGVEQKVLFNLLALRAGYFTYGPLSDNYFTYGVGLNLAALNLNLAAANSIADMNNSMAMAGIGVTF